MKLSIRHTLIVLATLATISTSALAQYVWLDEKGNKQFSDQPPPASVPKNKILKFSGKIIDNQDSSTDADNSKAGTTKPADSLADKELAFKKRRDELAAKEKKDADEAKASAAKSDNCKRMREYKQSLDSGQRISQMDATGQKSYMTDEKRAQEQTQLSQNLSDCGN
ncbi:DUF4124 domain-containing protein [Solimicrobium silvestre]|uniref:DUF4124 domain-containing protein n=1 Tax=Solimicrobium silvestre TaxID=2099400 RepID=A0A2S9GZC9_9BURK|nr:DUF4124 domain-containing protein [Solimicrobium silvestre]PRC93058.1 hypothetical protein S2091_2144 [Solimicrobium silvestre]